MARRSNWTKSSGKHSAELKGLYKAEFDKLVTQKDVAFTTYEELRRLALAPGGELLAEIRRENAAKAREARRLKEEAKAKKHKQEAIRRFEAKRKASISSKKSDT